tara:strand:+ start:1204 stop:1428 length:225 start_codon:yes stop_codon:yes gene_type:complete
MEFAFRVFCASRGQSHKENKEERKNFGDCWNLGWGDSPNIRQLAVDVFGEDSDTPWETLGGKVSQNRPTGSDAR